MANKPILSNNNQYYVGTTVNLLHRMQEHINGIDTFTRKHLPVTLVYFEEYSIEEQAVAREKQIKGWSRVKKEKLISGEWTKQ